MRFLLKNTMELSDTTIPDIFITEYMKELDFNSIKLYLYILYSNKSKKEISLDNLAKVLCFSKDDLNKAFNMLEQNNLLVKTEKEYIIQDIKEVEVQKIYTPKLCTKSKSKKLDDPERIEFIKGINDAFFAGTMPTRWYIDIQKYMDKFGFDNDVIMGLFTVCKKSNKLVNNYVSTVASAWSAAGIKTEEDLSEYLEGQKRLRKVENQIKKFLRCSQNLNEADIKFVKKWVDEFNYDYPLIEEALLKTSGKQNPLAYANRILHNWNSEGIKNVAELKEFNKTQKEMTTSTATIINSKNNSSNFVKRQYSNLDSLFDNMGED